MYLPSGTLVVWLLLRSLRRIGRNPFFASNMLNILAPVSSSNSHNIVIGWQVKVAAYDCFVGDLMDPGTPLPEWILFAYYYPLCGLLYLQTSHHLGHQCSHDMSVEFSLPEVSCSNRETKLAMMATFLVSLLLQLLLILLRPVASSFPPLLLLLSLLQPPLFPCSLSASISKT